LIHLYTNNAGGEGRGEGESNQKWGKRRGEVVEGRGVGSWYQTKTFFSSQSNVSQTFFMIFL